ncbi:MAG: hypothetical protein R2713_20535 [Ilumatobacteraceae bacterium]
MVYHANKNWLHGGFLGVEVFFVISGYLITLLLIAEHERSAGSSTWKRSGSPACGACCRRCSWSALLMVYLALFKTEESVAVRAAASPRRPRGTCRTGTRCGWKQGTPPPRTSPRCGTCGLRGGEQFYLLWPLIMVAILRRGQGRLPQMGLATVRRGGGDLRADVGVVRRRRHRLVHAQRAATTSCWIVADRCISINDTLYLSTITRAGGLMLGAAFAMVWRPVAIMRGPMRDKGRELDVLAVVGLVGLAALTWFVHLADPALNILTGSRFDPWLFRGGLFLTGVCTLFVVAAVTHQRAMAGVLLGTPVLSWIGLRLHGAHLYHWPIYQIFRQEAGKTLPLWQFVVAMLITGALTEASYRYVEMPIRKGAIGRWMLGRAAAPVVAGARPPTPAHRRRRGAHRARRLGRREHRDGTQPVRRHGGVRRGERDVSCSRTHRPPPWPAVAPWRRPIRTPRSTRTPRSIPTPRSTRNATLDPTPDHLRRRRPEHTLDPTRRRRRSPTAAPSHGAGGGTAADRDR